MSKNVFELFLVGWGGGGGSNQTLFDNFYNMVERMNLKWSMYAT